MILYNGWDGSNYIDGGAGNDLLISVGVADTFIGGNGNDTVNGDSSSNSYVNVGNGDDYVNARYAGYDTIISGNGNDVILHSYQGVYIDTGRGNDTITMYGDNNTYSSDVNTIYGGEGNDFILLSRVMDIVYGGDGDDIIEEYSYSIQGKIFADAGSDTIFGGSGEVHGGAGNDYIDGAQYSNTGDLSDTLMGEDGDDTIKAETSYDIVYGGAGNDWLIIKNANSFENVYYGGTGLDHFEVSVIVNCDVSIGDFTISDGDIIDIKQTLASGVAQSYVAANETEGTLITVTLTDHTVSFESYIHVLGVYDLPSSAIQYV